MMSSIKKCSSFSFCLIFLLQFCHLVSSMMARHSSSSSSKTHHHHHHNPSSPATPPPMLRALVVLQTAPFKLTHFYLHKRLAEILEADPLNVEYVHLLALTTSIESIEVGKRWAELENGRLVIQYESTFPPGEVAASGQGKVAVAEIKNPWAVRERFNPYPGPYNKWKAVLQNERLIGQLDALHFNIGILETTNTAGLSLLEMLPTIQRRVATSSIVPYTILFEHLGFHQVKEHIPDLNYAEIGDDEIIGKSVKELKELANKNGEKRQKEIRAKNLEQLEIRAIQDLETWKSYHPVVEHHLRTHHPEYYGADYECPKLGELFKGVDHFFVNSQLSLNFPKLQEIISLPKNDLQKKLRFFGGIGLPAEHSLDDDPKDVNKLQTKGILEGDAHILSQIEPDSAQTKCHENILNIPPLNKRQKLMPGHHQHYGDRKEFAGKKVLVIFGTYFKMSGMPPEMGAAIRGAFLELGEQFGLEFIWKFKDAGDRRYSCDGNIFLNSWVPQPAVLAHPNTILFISHCGNNSVQESAYFDVPLICFPLSGDQYYNAVAMASRGWAKVLDVRNTAGLKARLVDAVRQMIHKGKLKMHMKNRKEMAKEFHEAIVNLRTKMFSLQDACGGIPIWAMRPFEFLDKNGGMVANILKARAHKDHGRVSSIFMGYLNEGKGFSPEKCVAIKMTQRDEAHKEAAENNIETTKEIGKYYSGLGKKPKYLIDVLHLGETGAFYVTIMEMATGSHRKIWNSENFVGIEGENKVREEAKNFLMPLEELHKVALIHGDVKRDNFVRLHSVLKLIDFDASQRLPSSLQKADGHARANHLVPPFWPNRWGIFHAPEFGTEGAEMKISTKIDIWSVGMIIFELFLWQPKYKLDEKALFALLRQIADIYRHFRWVDSENEFTSKLGNERANVKVRQSLAFDANWLHEYSTAIWHILENLLQINAEKRLTASGALNYLDGKCQPAQLDVGDIAGIGGVLESLLLAANDAKELMDMFGRGSEVMAKLMAAHNQIGHKRNICEA